KGIRRQAPWHFEQETAERLLTQQFQTRDLSGFGCDGLTLAIQAAGCLLNYARETQRTALPHIRRLIRERREDRIILDAASRRNLKIDTNLSGGHQYTLAWVMDKTATAMGGRLLRRWLNRPLRNVGLVRARQNAVRAMQEQFLYEPLHDILRQIGDVARILARVGLRAARPRDLARRRDSLNVLPELQALIADVSSEHITKLAQTITTYPELADLLARAIIDNPPMVIRDGGVLCEGYDAELDELRGLSENAGQYLIDVEQRERERTGIPT